MFVVLISVALCAFIHLAVLALVGPVLGATLREASYGLGPQIARFGRFRLKAVPLGGAVVFKDSRQEELEPEEMGDAVDGRPLVVQLAISASGCLALVALAVVVLGQEGIPAFFEGFAQIVTGALSPLGKAQALLVQGENRLAGQPFLIVLGLVAAKFAALNLLPLPGANGGYLVATIARRAGLDRYWPQQLSATLLIVYVAVYASWLCALVVYLTHRIN